MVVCIIALPLFLILSIFSVRYRRLTKEAMDCLFHTLARKKCESALDQRIKTRLSGGIMRYSPKLGAWFYRNYLIITLILTIVFILSTIFTAIGLYNYFQYGNCNGPDSSAFCILNPSLSALALLVRPRRK